MIGSKYLLPLPNTKVVHLLGDLIIWPNLLLLGTVPGVSNGFRAKREGTGCRSGRILTPSSPPSLCSGRPLRRTSRRGASFGTQNRAMFIPNSRTASSCFGSWAPGQQGGGGGAGRQGKSGDIRTRFTQFRFGWGLSKYPQKFVPKKYALPLLTHTDTRARKPAPVGSALHRTPPHLLGGREYLGAQTKAAQCPGQRGDGIRWGVCVGVGGPDGPRGRAGGGRP